jgi:hypothetical protein
VQDHAQPINAKLPQGFPVCDVIVE